MFKKSNTLINNQGGAIIVEFAFVTFIIVLFIKLLITIAEYQSISGKLDRLSYSAAGIIRERGRLYSNAPELNQQQVDQLRDLVQRALQNSGVSANNLTMTVETLHFAPVQPPGSRQQQINEHKSGSFNTGACSPAQPLRGQVALSPLSQSERWVPLYQVTICLPPPQRYRDLIPQLTMKSSAITIER